MKQQTVMQIMYDELISYEYLIPLELIIKCKELIEMEKQQIIDAYANAVMKENNSDYVGMHEQSSGEIYFDETFKK